MAARETAARGWGGEQIENQAAFEAAGQVAHDRGPLRGKGEAISGSFAGGLS